MLCLTFCWINQELSSCYEAFSVLAFSGRSASSFLCGCSGPRGSGLKMLPWLWMMTLNNWPFLIRYAPPCGKSDQTLLYPEPTCAPLYSQCCEPGCTNRVPFFCGTKPSLRIIFIQVIRTLSQGWGGEAMPKIATWKNRLKSIDFKPPKGTSLVHQTIRNSIKMHKAGLHDHEASDCIFKTPNFISVIPHNLCSKTLKANYSEVFL